jgi:hypothetical protein
MFGDAVLAVDGQQQRLAELPLTCGYHHTAADNEETAEYVVPVDWVSTRTREHAIRQKGLFGPDPCALLTLVALMGAAMRDPRPSDIGGPGFMGVVPALG